MSGLPPSLSPKDLLYPCQRRFVDDHSQFKIGVATRQWGKSTVTSGEAVHDCLVDPGTKWVCMSAGERQSIEWLNKAKEWLTAYRLVIEDIAEDRGGIAEGLLRASEIHLNNGSKIIAIPANPGTARGYSANIILDEFAYHENPDAIWGAMFPSTTNELAGSFMERWRAMLKGQEADLRRKLKLRVVSTFNGRNNKFFKLYERAAENSYSVHRVTIHDAVADGMPLDVKNLRKGLDDPDLWAQEYECEPVDSSSVLLAYELIGLVESDLASSSAPSEFWHGSQRKNLVMGIDFARSRDLSVAWTNEILGDVEHTRDVVEMRSMSTPDQIDLLRPRLRKVGRVCLDYTGPGIGMGDYLVKEFGEWAPERDLFGKIELVTITNSIKVELFSKLKMAFEARCLRIPVEVAIREDLHSVHRVTTKTGMVTYRAPRSADGHADRCTALALAHRAAGNIESRVFQTLEEVQAVGGGSSAMDLDTPFIDFAG